MYAHYITHIPHTLYIHTHTIHTHTYFTLYTHRHTIHTHAQIHTHTHLFMGIVFSFIFLRIIVVITLLLNKHIIRLKA